MNLNPEKLPPLLALAFCGYLAWPHLLGDSRAKFANEKSETCAQREKPRQQDTGAYLRDPFLRTDKSDIYVQRLEEDELPDSETAYREELEELIQALPPLRATVISEKKPLASIGQAIYRVGDRVECPALETSLEIVRIEANVVALKWKSKEIELRLSGPSAVGAKTHGESQEAES